MVQIKVKRKLATGMNGNAEIGPVESEKSKRFFHKVHGPNCLCSEMGNTHNELDLLVQKGSVQGT